MTQPQQVDPLAGWPVGLIRGEGDYVRAAGVWYPASRSIGRFDHAGNLAVEPPSVGAEGPGEVAVSAVDLAARLAPTCRYRGLRFSVASVVDAHGGRQRSPVPAGDSHFSATLWAIDADGERAAELPGARVENAWSLSPGVWITVAVTELTEYLDNADFRPLLDFEEPDWPLILERRMALRTQIETEIGRRAELAHLGGEGLARFDAHLDNPLLGFELGPDEQTIFTARDARTGLDVATLDLDELLFRVFEHWTGVQAARRADKGSRAALQLEYLERIDPTWAQRRRLT